MCVLQVEVGYFVSLLLHCIFLRQGLSVKPELTIWLDVLPGKPWNPVHPCFYSAGLQVCVTLPTASSFTWVLGVCTQVLALARRAHTTKLPQPLDTALVMVHVGCSPERTQNH